MSHNRITLIISAVASLLAAGCAPKAQVSAPTLQNGQLTFRDPQQAVDVLKDAVDRQDREALNRIFGPQSQEMLSSGDDIDDVDEIKSFASAMDEGVTIRQEPNRNPSLKNRQLAFLEVGDSGYPFPIALHQQANGWRFDTAVGKQEIINRRIGRNEMKAIDTVHRYVVAQHAFSSMQERPRFARTFFSSPGKHDGLYWEESPGAPMSPLGPLVAAASVEGYTLNVLKSPLPYHGYHFAILGRQGPLARGGAMSYLDSKGEMTKGFGLVAYPANYGYSGVVTFVVGPDGIIYQKNLGPKTAKIAREMRSVNPDLSWVPVR